MTDGPDEFIRKALSIPADVKKQMEKPRAEERARRRWGVRETRPPKDLTE